MANPPPLRTPAPFKIVFGFAGLVLIVLVILAFTVDWRGQRSWEKIRSEISAKGESLDCKTLVSDPIPDDRNFYADPLWQELIDHRIAGGDRELDQLEPKLTEEEVAALQAKYPGLPWTPTPGHRSDAVKPLWPQDAGPTDDDASKAALTIDLLAPYDPLFKKLHELAKRPGGQFPLVYADGISMSLPHIPYLMRYGQALRARGLAHLAQGQSQAALEDFLLIGRLANTLRDDPILITLLVRVALNKAALEIAIRGLKSHSWSSDQLTTLNEHLAFFEFLPDYLRALRMERAIFNDLMTGMNRDGNQQEMGKAIDAAVQRDQDLGTKMQLTLWLSGYRQQTAYVTYMQSAIENLLASGTTGLPSNAQISESLSPAKIKDSRFRPFTDMLSALTLPPALNAEKTLAEVQTRITQTRVAIALERYYQENKTYPETLDALVPKFLPAVPADIIDLQPLRYRLINAQEYTLYSVGWNRTDEQGLPSSRKNEADWVWGGTASTGAKD